MAFCLTGCATLPIPRPAVADVAQERGARQEALINDFEARRTVAETAAALKHWEQGDADACQQILKTVLARDPSAIEARRLLADLYVEQGKSAEARLQLQRVLELQPDDGPAHHALGLVLEAAGRAKEAQDHFRLALQQDPENALYRLSLEASAEGKGKAPGSSKQQSSSATE